MTREIRVRKFGIALLAAAALAGCGGDDEGSATEAPADATAALTVEAVMDFTTGFAAETPLTESGGEYENCAWSADETFKEDWTAAAPADAVELFECTTEFTNEGEPGEVPISVVEFEGEAALETYIEDSLFSTGTQYFVEGTIFVKAYSLDQEAEFYEALAADCACGEIRTE